MILFHKGDGGAIVADNGTIKAVIAPSMTATWVQFKRMEDGRLHGHPVLFGAHCEVMDIMRYVADTLDGRGEKDGFSVDGFNRWADESGEDGGGIGMAEPAPHGGIVE